MKKAPIRLIEKYLKDELTPAEEAELNHWYDSFEEESDPTANLSREEQIILRKRMLEKIRSRVGGKPGFFRVMRWLPVAASIVLVLVIAILSIRTRQKASMVKAPVESKADIIVSNKSTRLARFRFSDGSIAWLRPGGILRFHKEFNNGEIRKVSLLGEAFFEVARNPRKPFIVQTGKVFTRVLGTSFNIRHRHKNFPTEVSVITGKVQVYTHKENSPGKDHSVTLLPFEKAVYEEKQEVLTAKKESDLRMDLWHHTSVSFSNIPVGEVVAALNKKFKVHIQITDPEINNYLLKADFTDVNLPTVLEILSRSLDISYEISDKGIFMSKAN